MENFLNNLNEKILIIDYTGKILFLNKSLLIQLGYKPNEIINKNILSLTFTKDINAFLLKDTPLKNLYIISKNSFPIEFIKYIIDITSGSIVPLCLISE